MPSASSSSSSSPSSSGLPSSNSSASQSSSASSSGAQGDRSSDASSSAASQSSASSSSTSGSQGQAADSASQTAGAGPTAAPTSGSGASDSPGRDAGSQSRFPGQQSGADGSRDSATGDLNDGNQGSSSSGLGGASGDYSLDTLPDGVLSGAGGGQSAGVMTAAERAAVLDDRLRRGYETFDGFILSERERAQSESNAAGSVAIGGSDGGGNEGQPQTLPESGVVVASQQVSTPPARTESFPPPEDIPSGRDDDVVARQLREAAMSEPDPELREALWDEYRNYTGLGEPQ